jgi:hypothetical protein
MGQKSKTKIMSLDLSTTCTGYATFLGKKLKDYGVLTAKVKGISKMKYPVASLERSKSLSDQLVTLIREHEPDLLVVEEINRGKSRISQKTLDGLHFIFYLKLQEAFPELFNTMILMDSDGKEGWRTVLDIKITPEDRKYNKTCTKKNKKRKVNKKDAAQRWVNSNWGTEFDVVANKKDEDVVDAIGLGSAFLKKD